MQTEQPITSQKDNTPLINTAAGTPLIPTTSSVNVEFMKPSGAAPRSDDHDEAAASNYPPAADTKVQEEETNGSPDEKENMSLGGSIGKKAFCLLDGIFEKGGERSRVTIPLTRLPAVLGRSHATGDVNFFSLGPAKALSRQHCLIDYRDETGGKLVTPKSAARESAEEETLEYEKGQPFTVRNSKGSGETSAFVLEALGKNVIMVGKQRIRQGEVAVLTSGTPIKMSGYSLYFMLPTDTPDEPTLMDIPIFSATSNSSKSPTKKAGVKRKMSSSSSVASKDPPTQPSVKKGKAQPFAQLQAELDALSLDTLLERMDEAVKADRWERKHQILGATISSYAIKDATSAPEIVALAREDGIPRMDIMEWIRVSPKYARWVEQMNSKMEPKSYQNTITKALIKAGHERTGTGGRYVRWILAGVPLNPDTGEDDEKSTAEDSIKQEARDDWKEGTGVGDKDKMKNDNEGGEEAGSNGDEKEEEEGDGDKDEAIQDLSNKVNAQKVVQGTALPVGGDPPEEGGPVDP